MPYCCSNPKCGREWDDKAAAENEFECTKKCGGRLLPIIQRGEQLTPLIPKLPATLAIMLDEYIREVTSYMALHRICGAVEICARFLTVILLSDVLRQRGSFPENLLKELCRNFSRPTLGSWINMVKAARKALPTENSRKMCILPELPDYINRFNQALGSGKSDPYEKLLPMRNLVAHSGRLPDDMADQLVAAHTESFENLMNGLAFLSEDKGVRLVAAASDSSVFVLNGLASEWKKPDSPEDICPGAESFHTDSMQLVVSGQPLDLFPLHAFGKIFYSRVVAK